MRNPLSVIYSFLTYRELFEIVGCLSQSERKFIRNSNIIDSRRSLRINEEYCMFLDDYSQLDYCLDIANTIEFVFTKFKKRFIMVFNMAINSIIKKNLVNKCSKTIKMCFKTLEIPDLENLNSNKKYALKTYQNLF